MGIAFNYILPLNATNPLSLCSNNQSGIIVEAAWNGDSTTPFVISFITPTSAYVTWQPWGYNASQPPIMYNWSTPLSKNSYVAWSQRATIDLIQFNLTIGSYSGEWNSNTTVFTPFCTFSFPWENRYPEWYVFGTSISQAQILPPPPFPPSTTTSSSLSTTTSHSSSNHSGNSELTLEITIAVAAAAVVVVSVLLFCVVRYYRKGKEMSERQLLNA